ncbi:Abi family protein [Enterococcus hirae]
MKPFKTYNQQLNKLREKGMIIPTGNEASKVKRILERENYYNIVNGYMTPFLKKDANGNIIKPKEFVSNTTFDELYALFIFDRKIRNILLEHLLCFETHFKTTVAYRYTEVNTSPNSYLDFHSYTTNKRQTEEIVNLISSLSNQIKKNVSKTHRRKAQDYVPNAIDHHLDDHDGVPLWVLVNFLTIGNMSYFYKALPHGIKNEIAKDFSKHLWREYNIPTKSRTTIRITDSTLEEVVKCVNYFRNICAHEERLFNYKLYSVRQSMFNKTFNSFQQLRNKPTLSPNSLSGNLFTLLVILKLVLPKKNMKKLVRCINQSIEEYRKKENNFIVDDLIYMMGFPKDWNNYLG